MWLTSLLFAMSFTVLYAQNPKKYYRTGQEFLSKKSYQDAIEQFSKAIELKPEYTDAYIARAEVYETLDEKEKALEDYKRTLVFLTKDGTIYYHAGKLYAELGQHEQAVEMLDKAISLTKKPVAAYRIDLCDAGALFQRDGRRHCQPQDDGPLLQGRGELRPQTGVYKGSRHQQGDTEDHRQEAVPHKIADEGQEEPVQGFHDAVLSRLHRAVSGSIVLSLRPAHQQV